MNYRKANYLLKICCLFFFLIIMSLFVANLSFINLLYADSHPELKLYYFYAKDCKSCEKISIFLDELTAGKYRNIEIERYEVAENTGNLKLLFNILENPVFKTDKKEIDVPVIFIEDKVLIGEKEITENLNNLLASLEKSGSYTNNAGQVIKSYYTKDYEEDRIEDTSFITIPALIVSALLDSINPCAIAVIIFLISTLLANMNRKNILIYGLIYIFTIFIIYLSLGLGLVYVIRKINIPHLIFIIIGSVLIIMGILSVKDYFAYGKGISLGIPDRLKEPVKKNIQKATVASIIFVGFITSIFESLCSGAIYLGVISMISRYGLDLKLFAYLVVYNFIFVIPLLTILLIFYFGLPLKKINRFLISRNKRIYRLISGVILIFLGIYLIVWF